MPGFSDAIALHLVEISPVLQAQQQRALAEVASPVAWHKTLDDVPAGPSIVVANEFFDALPVNQAVKLDSGWHERCVGIGDDGSLAFTLAPRSDRAVRPRCCRRRCAKRRSARSSNGATTSSRMELGRRIADQAAPRW